MDELIGEAIERGVSAAFGFWLSQHDVTVPDIIENAMREKFGEWLDEHTEEIIDRIARYRARDG